MSNLYPKLYHVFLVSILVLMALSTSLITFAQEQEEELAESGAGTSSPEQAATKLEANQEELLIQQDELTKLDAKINELSSQHDSAAQQAELAASQLSSINGQLRVTELALTQTSLAIIVTDSDINEIAKEVQATEEDVIHTRIRLSDTMRRLYHHENTPILQVIFGADTLSGLLSERRTFYTLQASTLDLIKELRDQQDNLAEQHQKLSQRQDSLQQLKESQSYQQVDLKYKQTDKNEFLSLQKAQQAKYQQQITEAKEARTEITQNLFKLQALGLEVGLNDAFSAAQYASKLTGVRPALILGIVKVETNVGANIGSGHYPDDMHPGSREAFLRITKKLKLDPFTTQVSRRPSNYQGWGGAMGPGQFMPATWETIEARIAALTDNPQPNPFELVDALVGVGMMMSDRGAADRAKEAEAVGRYLAGPNWQYHRWYVDKVLAVAAEYAKEF